MLYLSKIRIKNIKCFEDITIDLESDNETKASLMLLGDNGTGKTLNGPH